MYRRVRQIAPHVESRHRVSEEASVHVHLNIDSDHARSATIARPYQIANAGLVPLRVVYQDQMSFLLRMIHVLDESAVGLLFRCEQHAEHSEPQRLALKTDFLLLLVVVESAKTK